MIRNSLNPCGGRHLVALSRFPRSDDQMDPNMTDKFLRVSVIMPVFNGEAYLAEAIDSVLNQSLTDFEFLIHDDGSTDATPRILEDYARRDPRIVLSGGQNLGVAATLNSLISRARAPYLARFDADDVNLPDRLKRQAAHLDQHPDTGVVGCWSTIMDQAGRRIVPNRMALTHEEIDDRNLRGLCSICHPAVMMRRDLVDRVGGYNVACDSAEDLDLWLRMAEICRIENMPFIGLHYRMHLNSVSDRKKEQQLTSASHACASARQRRGIDVPFDYFPWRPSDAVENPAETYMRYAWQAWKNGYREGWRHYALQSVKVAPWKVAAWKVLLAGLRHPSTT